MLAGQEPCDALGISRLLAAAADGEVVEVDAPAARLGDLEERQIGLAVQRMFLHVGARHRGNCMFIKAFYAL